MIQPHGHLLPSVSLQAAAQPLSVDTILRSVSLGDGDSFSSYFTGVALPDGVSIATAQTAAPGVLSPVLAQQFDQDILGDMANVWSNFVDSGQLWALLFGIVVGYMIRNLTAF